MDASNSRPAMAAQPRSACQANAAAQPASPSRDANAALTCTICGHAVYGVHCKLVCPNCGYREDCSDIFRA